MPVVEIFMRRGRPPEVIADITAAVHEALVEAYEVHGDDRFQIVSQHEPHELVFDPHFAGGPRTDDFLLVRVTAGKPRSVETKRKLYVLMVRNLATCAAIEPADVFIIVDNVEMTDLSVSGGRPFDVVLKGIAAEQDVSSETQPELRESHQWHRKGLQVRNEVMGHEFVAKALAGAVGTESQALQEYVTEQVWGAIWTRADLDRRSRSLVTLGVLIATRAYEELVGHVRAALRNGLTTKEIREVVFHTAGYCGSPAALSAMRVVQRVLDENSIVSTLVDTA